MSGKTVLNRSLQAALVAAVTFHAGGAAAIDFQIGENTLKVESLFTIGGSWRMQDRDASTIGKANLIDGLCNIRETGTYESGPSAYPEAPAGQTGGTGGANAPNQFGEGIVHEACTTTDAARLGEYLAYPGSNNPNSDQGNLNFDKGDLVHAVAKYTADISFSMYDYNLFMRPIAYFDANYVDFTEKHPVTILQAHESALPSGVVDEVGFDLHMLDYNISHVFTIADHDVNVKIGNQVLNWGESSLLVFNSLNTINPLDATKLRFPGADLKEFFRPVGLAVIGTDLFENVSVEGWYQYRWEPLRVDPVGSYFSQSDLLGTGGYYAMLSQGRMPDDPGFATDDPRYASTGMRGYYRAIDTCNHAPSADSPTGCIDPIGALGSTSSRTVYRDFSEEADRMPAHTGQYGAKLQLFLENFNNGTELSFYYANYHSRLPIASFFAADQTCLVGGNFGASSASCGFAQPGGTTIAPGVVLPVGINADNPATAEDEEAVPVDTVRVAVEYPEDIHLFGVSFNTTIGDYALAGEYAYRDNLPVQIHTTDLFFAALQPAFPSSDVTVIPGALTVPGRRSAAPDFVTQYRKPGCVHNDDAAANRCVQPGEYIPGYERLEVGQANLSILRLIGGDNPIGASQMTILFEMGMNQVFNMPGLDELQFNGGGSDVHISEGADGSVGINPADVRENGDPYTNSQTASLHQNVTSQLPDKAAFGTSESYGYRLLNLNRWDSALFGANLETLIIVQHDFKGMTPGIGTNFVDGRKQFAFGLRFDYLSTYIGEVRYSWNTGGGNHDYLRDRDNIAVSLGIQF